MAVGVVEVLEVVDVAEGDGHGLGAREDRRRVVLEAAPVGQARERVGAGLELALLEGAEDADAFAEALGDDLEHVLHAARRSSARNSI